MKNFNYIAVNGKQVIASFDVGLKQHFINTFPCTIHELKSVGTGVFQTDKGYVNANTYLTTNNELYYMITEYSDNFVSIQEAYSIFK